jgi:glycolate oxidase FAD binding subunit
MWRTPPKPPDSRSVTNAGARRDASNLLAMAAIEFPSAETDLALREKFAALVGAEHVRAATSGDAVGGVQPKLVIEPANENEIAKVLRAANEAGLAIAPRGGGTKINWGNPPRRADAVLSAARLNRVIEHAWADLTVSVESGCPMATLQESLARHGQRLAIDALFPERATIGGVLSTNDSGVLRLRFGSLRDLIIGVTIAPPDGTLASSGGKVVKNVAGYDLPKLVTGAFGTLGVITRAVFRLHPLPKNTRTFSMNAGDGERTQALLLKIQDSKLAHTALQVRQQAAQQPVLDILFEGTTEGLAGQEEILKKLAGPISITAASAGESSSRTWDARQNLWHDLKDSSGVAKISVLPSEIAATLAFIETLAARHALQCSSVFQATGIGWLCIDGDASQIIAFLQELRGEAERKSGSLTILRAPNSVAPLDAWGATGDSLPIMRAIKQQLDPKRTLNAGRFVGGI